MWELELDVSFGAGTIVGRRFGIVMKCHSFPFWSSARATVMSVLVSHEVIVIVF